MIRTRRLVKCSVVLFVAALVGAACGELGEPYLGAVPGEELAQEPVGEPQSEAGDVAASPDSAPAEFVPERPDGYVPPAIVASSAGAGLIGAAGIELFGEPVASHDLARAFDDLFGGLVAQDTAGGILWFTGGSEDGRLISEGGGVLLDVGFNAGSTEALIATAADSFERYGLVDGERSEVVRLDEGEALLDVAGGSGLYLVALSDGVCGQLRFLDGNGGPVDLGGPVVEECALDGVNSFTSVAITPSGDLYAFTRVMYRSDGVEESTEIVIVDVATGSTESLEAAGPEQHISSIAFDGSRVAFVRSAQGASEAVVVDIAKPDEPSVTSVSEGAAISFARLPLRLVDG